jgi:zinc transporter ZupT
LEIVGYSLTPSLATILILSSGAAVAAAGVGVWLTGLPEISRKVVPVSGAVLLVLSLFWIMPELGETFGWPLGPALMFAGFTVIWIIDRYFYPVCPACSHTHDHDACSTRLHGFATPLIAAAMVHSIFDGWALAAGYAETATRVGAAISAGVLIHKLPESLAYGVILRAALRSRSQAVTWAIVAQLMTIAGALIGLASASLISAYTMGLLLALGGGTFLYLGFHAVHGEWKRRTSERAVRIG